MVTSAIDEPVPLAEAVVTWSAPTKGWQAQLGHAWRLWHTKVGLSLTLLIVLIGIVGPFFAPHQVSAFVGAPLSLPSGSAPLGSDNLGHDVLSELLNGGRSIIWMSFAATTLAVTVGASLGLTAAYAQNRTDNLIMRALDVSYAFPQLVLVLLFVSMLGHQLWLIVILVAWGFVPGVARVTRGTASGVVTSEYVEAAEVIGVPRRRIITVEILPNLVTPILADYSQRLTWSIGVMASISFLGFGVQPPNTDWGLMVNQNRSALGLQPWAALAPVACIALFTIGTNLLAEGISRTISGVDRTMEA